MANEASSGIGRGNRVASCGTCSSCSRPRTYLEHHVIIDIIIIITINIININIIIIVIVVIIIIIIIIIIIDVC